jgi:hypothetical protein
MTISLLVPSRGRPQQLSALWWTAMDTAADPDDIEMVVRLDDDDPSYDELCAAPRERVTFVVGPRLVLSELWNEAWRVARGDIFMHCGDDIRFRAEWNAIALPHWDDRVRMHFANSKDKLIFVHGRDGVQDHIIGTHGFISREWTDIIGYFVPPYYSSDYNDMHLTVVADKLGRRIYDDQIYTEHMHPVVNKGPMDQTHLDRLARHSRDNVDQLWHDLEHTRTEDALKLARVINAGS